MCYKYTANTTETSGYGAQASWLRKYKAHRSALPDPVATILIHSDSDVALLPPKLLKRIQQK